MAGGSGERFWPLSTKQKPKQLLHIFSEKSLLRKTYERVLPIVSKGNIFICTNEMQVPELKNDLPEINDKNIIIEPMFKDTAAAIGYGSLIINKYFENPTIVVLASDHLIKDEDEFRKVILIAESEANKGNIITLGITPTYPETGYGYIQVDNNELNILTKSLGFKEKPKFDLAKEYFESKKYLWNSGMFIFNYSTIMKSFEEYAYSHYKVFKEIDEVIDKNEGLVTTNKVKQYFDKFEKKSIDFAVMEKANNIYVIPSSFGWNDVGSYEAFDELFDKDECGNVVVNSKVCYVDSRNNIIISQGNKLNVNLLGISNKVVAITSDNILICDKNKVQEIKELLKKVK